MSIPKLIHYCWFGGRPKPKLVLKCIESWKKYCPDYEIIEWNESNFDVHANRYAREAYEQGMWAFVSDYARLEIIYAHGGIYLDTDVELLRPLDDLAEGYEGFMGFENPKQVATGLGFGAIAGHPLIGTMLADYRDIPFRLGEKHFDTLPCPDRSTKQLVDRGLRLDNSEQVIDGIRILPSDYLCPQNFYTGKRIISPNTHSIHHYAATWLSPVAKRSTAMRRFLGERYYAMLYTRVLSKIGGWEW